MTLSWPLRAAYEIVRDTAITGTGLWIIWRQVLFSPLHPSGLLLGTGLALTVPSVAAHVKALLPGTDDGSEPYPGAHGGGPPSSSPSPARRLPRLPSSPQPGSPDDGLGARFLRWTGALR